MQISTMKLIMLMNVGGFGFIVFIVLVITKGVLLRLRILGWTCLIFSLCVFVAPLCIMIPNVLGFSFGIVQMVLYAIYKNSKQIMEDSKVQNLPELTSDQIIEVVKLNSINMGCREINAVELPEMAAVNIHEGICTIEIHNVHQPTEETKKTSVEEEVTAAPAAANLTLAAY
ncbi:hypothetical protein Nepgr_002964 [Nepenthes gracilis]|uniref:Uncharacterized protein n=1 Tax=Nepenthes gracilis TaxID=150966 RepID=A0AAD3XD08_NEPGR|nr:hypothetical protein Nepgr_002964 [Nepenthes gracilis]